MSKCVCKCNSNNTRKHSFTLINFGELSYAPRGIHRAREHQPELRAPFGPGLALRGGHALQRCARCMREKIFLPCYVTCNSHTAVFFLRCRSAISWRAILVLLSRSLSMINCYLEITANATLMANFSHSTSPFISCIESCSHAISQIAQTEEERERGEVNENFSCHLLRAKELISPMFVSNTMFFQLANAHCACNVMQLI